MHYPEVSYEAVGICEANLICFNIYSVRVQTLRKTMESLKIRAGYTQNESQPHYHCLLYSKQ